MVLIKMRYYFETCVNLKKKFEKDYFGRKALINGRDINVYERRSVNNVL